MLDRSNKEFQIVIMRSNYHNINNQSEDSVTKISRSKSRNQMNIASKIKGKVPNLSPRNAAGMIGFTFNKYLSIIIRISLTLNVTLYSFRSEK